MPFTHLSDLLQPNVRKKGLSAQVQAAMALELFDQIAQKLFDPEALKAMRAMYVKDRILTVAVLSPVLAQELKLNEPAVLAYINDKAGQQIVSRIRFLS